MKMRLYAMSLFQYGAARAWGKAILIALALGGAAPGLADDAAAPGEVRVMTFGDSLTAGYGLERKDGFVAQLGDWLHAHGTPEGVAVHLLNASVSGSTTAGGVRRIDWALGDAPDAMIVELGGNDLLRGIDPAETRANLDKILATAREHGIKVLLVGLVAKDNYGAEYRAAFNAIYPDLAEKYGTLLKLDFLAALPEVPGERVAYIQNDGTHPNARGVALIVQDIGPVVQKLVARSLAATP